MNQDEARELLRISVGNPDADFRDGQWEAIDAIANRRRKLLVVQRTGWGKSSVYFISTRILRDQGAGPTLIVSPLLALMRNQIDAAEALGIRATRIDSTNQDDWPVLNEQVLAGEYDALLVSPERLSNEKFVDNVLLPLANRIGLLVVDEAHCISDWGHDFRPDYRRLVNVLQQMPPNMPVLGTTATANDRVINDVVNQLGDIDVVRGSLARESLALQTVVLEDQASRLAWLAQNVPNLDGTGIIYVLTKRDADRVTGWLQQHDIDACAYYSGISHDDFENENEYRQHLEQKLLENEIKVLVATVALGMGYDKPDLAFVIHYQAPGSVVGYYQQVGRAGRGIDRAVVVLLSGAEDVNIHEYFRRTAFPTENQVHEILSALEESDGLNVRDLEGRVNLRFGQITAVVKYLSVENPAPVIKQGSRWVRTPVNYQLDHEKIERLTGQRETEWEEIQDFIATDGCLMEYLRSALDDPGADACGRCANCLDEPIVPVDIDHDIGIQAASFLKRAEMPLETKKQVAAGAFEVYEFQGNLPQNLRAFEGRVLSRWGDAGWGQMVVTGKHANHFSDELVAASAEMIMERWRPDPMPEWVTCVPSRNHPELVPHFAERLAEALGLPFLQVVEKVRNNQPQKQQQNRFRQCKNLDGAFSIEGEVPGSAVLLVDDVADSRWTMTVVAAILLEAGSGPVLPFALADTSTTG
jgi:ATP-dependent DNA helicase RecQ